MFAQSRQLASAFPTRGKQRREPGLLSVKRTMATYPKALSPCGPSPHASRAFASWQYGLHGPVRVLYSLAAVGVRDQLGLAISGRTAVGMLDVVGRGVAADGSRLGRSIPLRRARGQLHEVVLFARGVPLGDPAPGEAPGVGKVGPSLPGRQGQSCVMLLLLWREGGESRSDECRRGSTRVGREVGAVRKKSRRNSQWASRCCGERGNGGAFLAGRCGWVVGPLRDFVLEEVPTARTRRRGGENKNEPSEWMSFR